MSSHHVVREKQEPALLVLGLNDLADEELLGQLLEWSPTVIATGTTAGALHARGIKIDWIIADNPSQPLQSDIKVLHAGCDSACEAALKYLVTYGYPAVNILTDRFYLKDVVYFTDKIVLVVFCKQKKIFAVKSGFRQWRPAGHIIEILTPPSKLKTSGLQPLEGWCYNTTHDGFFSLQFDKPFLFLAEQSGL
jgi:thiamine pyrophosphokinase